MLPVGCIHNAAGRQFGHFVLPSVKMPTTDFTVAATGILDEKHTITESKTQLIKQLQILQEIIVRIRCVAVLVVVTIDQQFDDWFATVSDQYTLFTSISDDWYANDSRIRTDGTTG